MEERKYGLDAFRCLAAFLVVLVHCTSPNNWASCIASNRYLEAYIWFLWLLSLCAVNCFGILTGYLGGGIKNHYKSFFKLYLQVFFYLIILFIASNYVLSGGKRMMLRKVFPILGDKYWYFTGYALVVVLKPLLECAIQILPRKELSKLIVGLLCLYVVPSILPWGPSKTLGAYYGFSAIWLVVLYLIGAYLRKYPISIQWLTASKCLIIALLFPLFGMLLHQMYYSGHATKLLDLFQTRHTFCVSMYNARAGEYCMMYYTHPLILGETIFLLLAFSKIKLNRIGLFFSYLSPYAFGVYLAHCNDVFYSLIKNPLLAWVRKQPHGHIPLLLIGIVLLMYIFSGCFDFLRALLFKFIYIVYDRIALLFIRKQPSQS